MKQKLFLGLSLLFILILTGCSGQWDRSSSPDAIIFRGTEGISLEFVRGVPPPQITEDNSFDVQVRLHNRGTYDVINEDFIELFLTYDSAMLRRTELQGMGYLDSGQVQLFGRSHSFQQGEQDFFNLARFQARPIQGNFETNQAAVHVGVCYPYQTSFSTQVCIDTSVSGVDQRTQVCSFVPRMTFSQGQGAPVAVTSLETSFDVIGAYVKPVFTFTIENRQSGIVNLPDSLCTETELVNRLSFQAELGDEPLDCPSELFFQDGRATVTCLVPTEGFLATAANYETTINAVLSYTYFDTFTTDVQVNRLNPIHDVEIPSLEGSCAPWEVQSGDDCYNLCDYCAINPGSSGCTPTDTLPGSATPKSIGEWYGCVFDRNECLQAGENCIRDEGAFCMPGLYCGAPACTYNPSQNQRPDLRLEPTSQPGIIRWYCQDRETSPQLHELCGCNRVSYYVPLPEGRLDCEDPSQVPPSSFIPVPSTHDSYAFRRTYFSIDRGDLPAGTQALCVRVEDAQGESRTQRFRLD